MSEEKLQEITAKFNKKLKQSLDYSEFHADITSSTSGGMPKGPTSKEYSDFKDAYLPLHITWFEKLCNLSYKALKIKAGPKDREMWDEAINTIHLQTTSDAISSFSLMGPAAVFLIGAVLFGILIPFIFGQPPIYFFVFFFGFVAMVIYFPIRLIPIYMAKSWKMKASSQMVLCIFYVVTYMRHTSNLELAIEFASEHLGPPLALDLRKVLWDVETAKYSSMRESLDMYLERWKKDCLEFVEAFHLIEGSLLEGDESRRLEALDKSLSVILEETYEKMLHYAQNLQQPITMLNMLGVILPILGLVVLPLMISFMENIKWYHIATLYNIFLPIMVYYLGKSILASRPSGYGDNDIGSNPNLAKYQKFNFLGLSVSAINAGIIVGVVLLICGLFPLIIHAANPTFDIIWNDQTRSFETTDTILIQPPSIAFLEYKCPTPGETCETNLLNGPFGLFATLFSICITLAAGLSFGVYYKLRSSNIMEVRQRSKDLEKEFGSALFQLGNRLGDGYPAEMAFGKVAENMDGTISGKFFEHVSNNIRSIGLSVEQAIFDPKVGALSKYPSSLIESSMKVLTESVKKGPKIAAQALINISQYVKEMHKVSERLKDLMAENMSSLKSQISFLTPSIAGIVIAITSMVTSILTKLTAKLGEITSGTGSAAGGMSGLMNMFKPPSVPAYYFQIIVGLYVVQIIYILSILANGIANGEDKLAERYTLAKNLTKSTILYGMIAFIMILIFNVIAGSILQT